MPGKHSQGREVAAPQTPSWNCLVNTRVVCIEIRGAVGQGLLRVWKDRGKNRGCWAGRGGALGPGKATLSPKVQGPAECQWCMKRKMGERGKRGAGWRYGGLAARAEGLHLTKVIGSHGLFRRDRCHFGWMPVLGCQFCEWAIERGRAWATTAEGRGRQDRRAPWTLSGLSGAGQGGSRDPPPPLERCNQEGALPAAWSP